MVKAIPEGAIADLVVVLEADHEPAGLDARRVGAARAACVLGMLPRVEPSLPDGRGDIGDGPGVVHVVAVAVACQRAPHFVVEVVGPHRVEPEATGLHGPHQVREVTVVLRDDRHVPPAH